MRRFVGRTPFIRVSRVREIPMADPEKVSLLSRINEVCDEFEDQLQSGARPLIEDFLESWEGPARADLFRALLELDRDYARRNLRPASASQYRSRFPRFSKLIDEIYSECPAHAELFPSESTGKTLLPEAADPGSEMSAEHRLGRYRIIEKLGEGGMGVVYLAEDIDLHRRVALKTPWMDGVANQEMLDRFYREARSAAALHHPNICPVHDLGVLDGRPYLTMAYIQGESLTDRCRADNLLDQYAAVDIIRRLSLGLAEAHEHGVIHRDIKPSNVKMDHKGNPVLMDFGLARGRDANALRLTQTGAILGTVAYMSPEQARGDKNIGPATDLYALGVVLYQLLTGELPYSGNMMTMLGKIAEGEPQPPSQLREALDPRIELACLKMMAKSPEDRYASAQDIAEELGVILNEPPPSIGARAGVIAAPTASSAATPTGGKQRRLWVGAVAITALIGFVATLWALGLIGR